MLADLNPLERYRGELGPLPNVDLEFHYETAKQPVWSVNRLLTLLGRSPLCKLRFDSTAVSGVHCGLLLTQHGLWAIDLLGRGGTKVDGENVRAVPLESGNAISVAAYQIGVFYEEPADLAAAERLTDNAAESDTSMDELESAFLQDEPVSRDSRDAAEEKKGAASQLDWRGSIFKLDVDASHADRDADRRGLRLSLSATARRGERFTTQARDTRVCESGGRSEQPELFRLRADWCADSAGSRGHKPEAAHAAMCGPSPKMLEVLESMRLTKLWPIFASRDDAMKHVTK